METSMENAADNMGSNSITPNEQFMRVSYTDIIIDDMLNIRSGNSDKRELSDAELEASIEKEGQIQAVKLRKEDDGLKLVAGQRRVEAIARINMRRQAEGKPELLVLAVESKTSDEEALRQACAENLKRLDMTGVEKGRLCNKIREQFGWKGRKGDVKVAEFLGMSKAWVSQSEKLLTLPEHVQRQIENGEITEAAAWVVPNIVPEKVDEVLEQARALQDAEEGVLNNVGVEPSDEESVDPAPTKGKKKSSTPSKPAKPAKKKALKAKHVKAAAAKVPGAQTDDKKSPISRGRIVDFFDSYRLGNENGIPFAYPVIQEFVAYFVDKFCTGKGTDETMARKYEAMIGPACKGEKVQSTFANTAAPKPVVSKAPGKTVTKPAAPAKKKPAAEKPGKK